MIEVKVSLRKMQLGMVMQPTGYSLTQIEFFLMRYNSIRGGLYAPSTPTSKLVSKYKR